MGATHVALLRGINVGRARRVAMADLRALCEELGYRDVETLLNSGSVVFTAPAGRRGDPGPRIEKAVASRLGVVSRVTVLTARELAAAVDGNPLLDRAKDPSRLLVLVLTNPKDRARLVPLARQDWTPDALALGARVAYLWCASGIHDNRLWQAAGRVLGDAQTARSWATMTKLVAMTKGRRKGPPARSSGRPEGVGLRLAAARVRSRR
jgi:uncharacterized protein (DUF1697 family)